MKKNFVSLIKGCIFAVPFEREKGCCWDGERSLMKQRPKAACHRRSAEGRGCLVAIDEKGKEDNSEILTMKSLILAQDER